jgi:hypothetical protein
MKTHLNTLFITTEGAWLGKDGETALCFYKPLRPSNLLFCVTFRVTLCDAFDDSDSS